MWQRKEKEHINKAAERKSRRFGSVGFTAPRDVAFVVVAVIPSNPYPFISCLAWLHYEENELTLTDGGSMRALSSDHPSFSVLFSFPVITFQGKSALAKCVWVHIAFAVCSCSRMYLQCVSKNSGVGKTKEMKSILVCAYARPFPSFGESDFLAGKKMILTNRDLSACIPPISFHPSISPLPSTQEHFMPCFRALAFPHSSLRSTS
jgi:hypothetical protein